jgi:hypothetical protein
VGPYWKLRREDYEPKGLRWASDYDCQRPRLIQIYNSSNVDLQGLRLERSGFWTVHICYSRKVTVDGVTIRNNIGGKGPSTDGIDVDSSSDVLVEHCDIECNDDAICLKAGRDSDGLRVNRPTEHVTIRDNTVRAGAAGVTFGSETSGGIHDVEARRIHVLGSVSNGILFKSASTRGGTVENIVIHDMDIQDIRVAIGVDAELEPQLQLRESAGGHHQRAGLLARAAHAGAAGVGTAAYPQRAKSPGSRRPARARVCGELLRGFAVAGISRSRIWTSRPRPPAAFRTRMGGSSRTRGFKRAMAAT